MQGYTVSSTFTLKDDLTPALERIARLAGVAGTKLDNLAAVRLTGLNKSIMAFVSNMNLATAACGAFGEAADRGFSAAAASADRMASAARSAAQSQREAVGAARAYANASSGGVPRGSGGVMSLWEEDRSSRWAGGPLIDGTVNRPLALSGGGRGGIPGIPSISAGGSGNGITPWVGGASGGAAGGYGGEGGAGGSGGGGGAGSGGGGGAGGNGGLGKALAGFAVSGAGQIIGGYGHDVLGFWGDAVDSAGKYRHQLELMKIAGMSNLEIAESTKAAWEITKTISTSTPAENIQTIGELRSILGNTDEAIKFAPEMAKLQGVLAAFGGNTDGLAYNAMLAAEQVGGTVDPKTGMPSPEHAQKYLDLFARAAISTHGKVDPQQILNFARTGGAVARNLSFEGLMSMIPIIQEMGGFRAGTAETSMNQQILGGVMPMRQVEDWAKFGLLDTKKITPTKTGVRLSPGAITGSDIFRSSPVEWIEKIFIPALEANGITDRQQITEQIMRLFSRQTSQREAADIAGQLYQIHREYDFQVQSLGLNSFDELKAKDPVMATSAVHEQWNTAMTGLGDALIPVMLPVLHGLTDALNVVGRFAMEHPDATRAIGLTVVGLGAAAVVLGGLATTVGSFMILQAGLPMLVAGIGSLTTALVGGGIAGAASLAAGAAAAVAALGPFVTILGVIAAGYEAYKLGKGAADIEQANKDDPTFYARSMGIPGHYSASPVGGIIGDGSDDGGPMGNVGAYKADHSDLANAIRSALMGTQVVMDKEPVGRLVTDYQSRETLRPPGDSGMFDTRLSPLFPTSN
jgi:hypothetical protein